MDIVTFLNAPIWNVLVLPYFVLAWVGYTLFTKRMAKQAHCLASILDVHRVWWMERMLLRENRIADATLISNLERNVNFFASTTMIIIAAILTALTNDFELTFFSQNLGENSSEYKLILMLAIMVYAFFTFTWSLRQYGFGSVLLGAAPLPEQIEFNARQLKEYAHATAKVLDQAGHSFNYGLRAYYFSMAVIAWFIHPLLFLISTSLVVAVLYHREFKSKPLRLMEMDADILQRVQEKK
ncbi:MAG: DUF599 domain-containing protein [Bermanella sp.]